MGQIATATAGVAHGPLNPYPRGLPLWRFRGMNRQELADEQNRVDQRRNALKEQLADKTFVHSLPAEQEGMLRRQLDIMNSYSAVLGERQANFYDPQPGQVEGIAIPADKGAEKAPEQPQVPTDTSRAAKTPVAPVQEQPQPQAKVQQQQKQAPVKKAVQKKAPTKMVSKKRS